MNMNEGSHAQAALSGTYRTLLGCCAHSWLCLGAIPGGRAHKYTGLRHSAHLL